jgi:hypothetical protein
MLMHISFLLCYLLISQLLHLKHCSNTFYISISSDVLSHEGQGRITLVQNRCDAA